MDPVDPDPDSDPDPHHCMFGAFSYCANGQHRGLPWLITGQIQKLPDTFYPNKKEMNRQKKYLTLLSL